MENEPTYDVVVNGEEQYSIWRSDSALPGGWTKTGVRGSKSECLAHIGEVWTDMRPASLRRRAAQHDTTSTVAPTEPANR